MGIGRMGIGHVGIGSIRIGGAWLAPVSGQVEVGQLAVVVKGHTDSGEPDVSVGVVDVVVEVGDGAQHETLELAVGETKGRVVETA